MSNPDIPLKVPYVKPLNEVSSLPFGSVTVRIISGVVPSEYLNVFVSIWK